MSLPVRKFCIWHSHLIFHKPMKLLAIVSLFLLRFLFLFFSFSSSSFVTFISKEVTFSHVLQTPADTRLCFLRSCLSKPAIFRFSISTDTCGITTSNRVNKAKRNNECHAFRKSYLKNFINVHFYQCRLI